MTPTTKHPLWVFARARAPHARSTLHASRFTYLVFAHTQTHSTFHNRVTHARTARARAHNKTNNEVASLDHGMHFHRRFDDMDLAVEWLLHATESPNASGGRGFARGSIYRRATGELLATTAQEGITRWRETRWTTA